MTYPQRPTVLVTGFTPFPGAPENPTQTLVGELSARADEWARRCQLVTAVLPVEWEALPRELERLGRERAPDIAIHFGLARSARGFRLERRGKRHVPEPRADTAGRTLAGGLLGDGPDEAASTLPLESIAAALDACGLPVEWSDDAGGYLCNAALWHACSGALSAYAPAMAGFVHVPLTSPDFSREMLERGARIVLDRCIHAWKPA